MDNETIMGIHKNNLSLKELPSIRQLRAFSVLYETGNVTTAANILSLTQPAITILLREFEGKLGVRLFERGPRGLQRTEAATEAMVYVRRVLDDLHEMNSNMKSIAVGKGGNLRIATTSTVAQTLMPRLLARFKEEHPLVRVTIDDCSPHEFAERISSERVHIGIGTLEASIPGLLEMPFQQDWLHAVGSRQTLNVHGKTVSWKQLEKLPIITVKTGYGVRRSIDQAAGEAHVHLQLIQEVALLSTALALAEQGLGIAIVPGSIVTSIDPVNLASLRIVRPSVPRRLSVIHKKGMQLPPSAEAFARMLEKLKSI